MFLGVRGGQKAGTVKVRSGSFFSGTGAIQLALRGLNRSGRKRAWDLVTEFCDLEV